MNVVRGEATLGKPVMSRPAPSPHIAVEATTERLGPIPDRVGRTSWSDEAASLLCAWWRRGFPDHPGGRRREHGGACKDCLRAVRLVTDYDRLNG